MKSPLLLPFLAVAILTMFSLITHAHAKDGPDYLKAKPDNVPVATFAGGCFWCIESEFRPLPGVLFTIVGYTGGHTDQPTYEDISSGRTGHAEAIEVYFDPEKITYEQLVEHFLTRAHDPTELNRQWVDVGTQYRSAIFTHNDEQVAAARGVIKKLTDERYFKKPIVTEIKPANAFWIAEDYHQNYYERYKEVNGEEHRRISAKKEMKKQKEKERLQGR